MKWIGGKARVVRHVLRRLPLKIGTYYEPLVGGGAVLFELIRAGRIERAVVSDMNPELMNAWFVIKHDVDHLIEELKGGGYVYDREAFLKIREMDRNPGLDKMSDLGRAARFIYLNRTCFTPGSMVLMENDMTVPIEDVKVGDRLWGGRVVQETFQQRYIGRIRRIRVSGSSFIASVTEDHPVICVLKHQLETEPLETYAFGNLHESRNLLPGDKVFLPTVGRIEKQVDWDGDHLLSSKIREITDIEYDGTVHNLEVDGDHLLCVDGIISHNCFNGLYRVNADGHFNVPFGRYKDPVICDEVNLRAAASALLKCEVLMADFETAVNPAGRGDAVYFDPPYIPTSKTSNFTGYTSEGFTLDDHVRLAKTFARLAKRGVRVVLSNSATPEAEELYGKFDIDWITSGRSVGGLADYRKKAVKEMIVFGGPKG